MSLLYSFFKDNSNISKNLHSSDAISIEDIASSYDESISVLEKNKKFEKTKFKIDYSNFSNFVFFNSAYDYFNVCGERILNEFPYDGKYLDFDNFYNEIDGYEEYLLKIWPKNSGHLKLTAATSSYVYVNDVGRYSNETKVGYLDPGTGSYSIECWCLTPPTSSLTQSNGFIPLVTKMSSSSNSGYCFSFISSSSGPKLSFKLADVNSNRIHLTCDYSYETLGYYSAVIDKSLNKVYIITGSSEKFPVVATSQSIPSNFGNIYTNNSRLLFCSASLQNSGTILFSGSIGEIRIWNSARSITSLSSSYNCKISSQKNLIGMWRFNESGSRSNNSSTVLDYSGHKYNGTIVNYSNTLRSSGSLIPYDHPDYLLSLEYPEVIDLIEEMQTSGSLYDKENHDNMITSLLPSEFFNLEDYRNTEILKNYLYMLARYFDELKVSIDQFVNIFSANYSEFDQTPDIFLNEACRFFGWESVPTFINQDVLKYIIGKDIHDNTRSNSDVEKKLYEIKNEFTRRCLINLPHIYKTKGTVESVNSFIRSNGISSNIVKLKEHVSFRNYPIKTQRIHSEKSSNMCRLSTGSYITSDIFRSFVNSVEFRVKFPTTSSNYLQCTQTTGSILRLYNENDHTTPLWFYWMKDSISNNSGSIVVKNLSNSQTAVLTGSFFDGGVYNVSFVTLNRTGSSNFSIRRLDSDNIGLYATVNDSASLDVATYFYNSALLTPNYIRLIVGTSASINSEQWVDEIRVWDNPTGTLYSSANEEYCLTNDELNDHCLNFQSISSVNYQDKLSLHWRLNEDVTASSLGTYNVFDSSLNKVNGTGTLFDVNENVYTKYLFDYNYIASPQNGFSNNLIISHDDNVGRKNSDIFPSNLVTLEFNMTDSLNEDISTILSSLKEYTDSISLANNKYNYSYQQLKKLRDLYYKRLQGRLNFRIFADMLEFFDSNFLNIIRKLIPARNNLQIDNFTVESHILERPKYEWKHLNQKSFRQDSNGQNIILEGVITMISR